MAGLNVDGSELNRLLTPDRIAMETLFQVRNKLLWPMLGTHALERYFVSQEGVKVSIKRPFRATASAGRKLTDAQINAMIDEVATLTIDERHKFAVNYSDDDMRLHISMFKERYLDEGCKELAYTQDIACAREVTNMTYQSDGTAGTTITTKTMGAVRAHCVDLGIDPMEAACMAKPSDVSALGDDVKLVNVPTMVNEAIRNKYMGKIDGFSLYETIHEPTLTVPHDLTGGMLAAAPAAGATSVSIDTLAVAAPAGARVIKKGQIVRFAGCYEVEPRGERESTGRLKDFTVTADVTIALGIQIVTLAISPPMNDGTQTVTSGDGTTTLAGAAYKNISARPADNALVTFIGTLDAGPTTYNQMTIFEKRGLQVANVALKRLKGFSDFQQATDPETGLTITISADADIKDMDEIRRCDILFGVLNPYPEVCMRVVNGSI